MTSPSLTIVFKEAAASLIERGIRGIVGLVLKGDAQNSYTVRSVADIPVTEAETNIAYIEDALKGYQASPLKIEVFVMGKDEDGKPDYKSALSYFETTKANILCFPTCVTDGKAEMISTWIKSQRTNDVQIKAVLPYGGDCDGVIDWESTLYKDGMGYAPERTTPRIAGLLAGTPATISATYAPLSDYDDVGRLTKEEQDAAVGQGKLIAFWDGEKVKLNRAVTSFVTTTDTKGDSFKKYKLVENMDMIKDDLTVTIQDSYIGKYANSYDNKCLLIGAVNAYFKSLAMDGIIESGNAAIDVERQRIYLEGLGKKVVVDGEEIEPKDLSDEQVERANTGSRVFLVGRLVLLDTMEDIDITLNI